MSKRSNESVLSEKVSIVEGKSYTKIHEIMMMKFYLAVERALQIDSGFCCGVCVRRTDETRPSLELIRECLFDIDLES